MLTLSLERLLAITGGDLLQGDLKAMINGLAIDSREIHPGSAFVAFVGEHADGHDFVGDALRAGARAVLVTRDGEDIRAQVTAARRHGIALVRIVDATTAVQALASYHRERLQCPVVAVTGSMGKTTTKDFLRSVLSTRMNVVATEANQNNELGVPLTVMRAGADTGVLVVEMAMRGAGQIAELAGIAKPTAGLVTNVGVSHVEILGSEEAIADAKAELVEAIPAGGRVFLNGDDAWSAAMAGRSVAPVTTYGLSEPCDVRGEDVTVDEAGNAAFTLRSELGREAVSLPLPGRHNVYNALAAAAVGLYFGLEPAEIVAGLAAARVTGMRMEVFESASGVTVLNDAYNANPASMRAAVATLSEMPVRGRRIAVLGDMAELGSLAALAHFQLGEVVAASAIDTLVTAGVLARRIADGARTAGMPEGSIRPCSSPDEASEVLDDLVRVGDVVLVKASRVMGLERVVDGIIEPHA